MLSTPLEVAAWLRIAHTGGVGRRIARTLLAALGPPEQILAADPMALRALAPQNVVDALLAPPDPALLERTLNWLAQPGNALLTLADPEYPPLLLEIPDPPLMLYVKGRHDLLTRPAIAVVGSRNATAQGAANAERFAEALSQAGLCVVSGMALGIDTAAHKGALRGPGSTVAVIGTGADVVYPARNRALAHEIAAGGCMVSEYPLGMPGIAANFPRRNRIISGLSRGVLVIEAAAHSGSLITARLAGEQGRDVFAVPGSIHSPLMKGCHLLLRQGAKLVESAADILEELPDFRSARQPAAPAPPSQLLAQIGFDPVDPDALAARCALDAAELGTQLLMLELDGLIERLPDGAYQRVI